MKRLPIVAVVSALGLSHAVQAADPGEAWLTETAAPEQVQWLPAASLCPVLKSEMPAAVKVLEARSFEALDLKTLTAYAGTSCKGKYAQFPYLVRAVSAAGEGHLDAGLLRGEVWMRYAGMGGRYPFEKTPVVLWLSAAPSRVHVSAGIVE